MVEVPPEVLYTGAGKRIQTARIRAKGAPMGVIAVTRQPCIQMIAFPVAIPLVGRGLIRGVFRVKAGIPDADPKDAMGPADAALNLNMEDM